MIARTIKWGIFLAIGFYLCAILTVIPLQLEFQWWRPHWLLLFIIFCQVSNPNAFNPLWAWVAGLLVDSLLGTRLGEHALVFAVVCYLAALLGPRFLLRPFWQQLNKVFLLVAAGQIGLLFIHGVEGQNPQTLFYWMGTLTSCAIWPFFVIILNFILYSLKFTPAQSRSI